MYKHTDYRREAFSEELLSVMVSVNFLHENYLSKRSNEDLSARIGETYPDVDYKTIDSLLVYFTEHKDPRLTKEISSLLRKIKDLLSLRKYVDFPTRERDTHIFVELNKTILLWSAGEQARDNK